MTRMTGGHSIVDSLVQYAVSTVFGLPGVQLDHLFNAFYDAANHIRVIHPRHEQAAGYMALGYAQSTGEVGTFAVVPGPGLLNASAALATAYACNAPVLALTGQIPSSAVGRGFGLLHELPDQLGLIGGITKWAAYIEHPSDAPRQVREAFRQLRSGVTRPVELEMAMDVFGLAAEVELLEPVDPDPPPAPDPESIQAAAKLLGKARRPLIVAGGGVQHAPRELLEVAELLQAPVVTHRMGRGCVSDRHYLALNATAGYRLWREADVVLAVGTRFQQHALTWGLDANLQVIRIDLDPKQMHRPCKPAVGVVADARQALAELASVLPGSLGKRASREAELSALKRSVRSEVESQLGPQVAFIDALRDVLPDDGILVDEQTQVGYVSRTMFPFYHPRTYLTSGYQGTLGSGYPTALGAKVANPDKPVLSINGDGGFMFNVQELATAALHAIPVVAVVFNDNAFGNVKRMQESLYDGRVIASELKNPDFVRLAECFDVAGYRAGSPEELRGALERAFAADAPALIEVPVGPMPDPWGISQPMGRARPAPT